MKQGNKIEKMEYGYIRFKKRQLLMQMVEILAGGAAVFGLGLMLNKGEFTNIFTVISVLFVIPAARCLTVWIVLAPYHTPDKLAYQEVQAFSKGHGLLLSDLVFTSPERAMHLDYMVLAGGQAYGYVAAGGKNEKGQIKEQDKKKRERIENYLNEHFQEKGYARKANVLEDFSAFKKAVLSHTLRDGELEEQEKVKKSMEYFMV